MAGSTLQFLLSLPAIGFGFLGHQLLNGIHQRIQIFLRRNQHL